MSAHVLDLTVREYQQLGTSIGIPDIFADCGGRTLQVLLACPGLMNRPGRKGNDAHDAAGHQYEIKSTTTKNTSFCTYRRLDAKVLKRYRLVSCVFINIELQIAYRVEPAVLEEPYFVKWS